MQAWSISTWLPVALATFALSALLTWLSIAYSHRRNLIDHPGQRRSHSMPTPRGGGIGIVVAALVGTWIICSLETRCETWQTLALSISILLVAGVGWIDDHRGLSARLRFSIHCLAAFVILACASVAPSSADESIILGVIAWSVLFVVALFSMVWSINLHNFMDGIDGLLATQALFVFGALALLCAQAGHLAEAQKIGLFAAATLGFLPFNFPKARIFMGDVGSGVLGLLVIVTVGWQMLAFPISMASGLIACSAFVVDATATLLSRMLRGRRWYSAHREHLYQWLVRSGRTHAEVVGLYMAWNLLVLAPILYWINREPGSSLETVQSGSWFSEAGGLALILVYLSAALVWVAGKRYCLAKARNRPGDMGAQ